MSTSRQEIQEQKRVIASSCSTWSLFLSYTSHGERSVVWKKLEKAFLSYRSSQRAKREAQQPVPGKISIDEEWIIYIRDVVLKDRRSTAIPSEDSAAGVEEAVQGDQKDADADDVKGVDDILPSEQAVRGAHDDAIDSVPLGQSSHEHSDDCSGCRPVARRLQQLEQWLTNIGYGLQAGGAESRAAATGEQGGVQNLQRSEEKLDSESRLEMSRLSARQTRCEEQLAALPPVLGGGWPRQLAGKPSIDARLIKLAERMTTLEVLMDEHNAMYAWWNTIQVTARERREDEADPSSLATMETASHPE
jgi:hypothetical protein